MGICVILSALALGAAQLPVRSYSVADGLPSNTIGSITRDGRGYLWFATREGLSRFDGYDFVNYGRANGLPRNAVLDFLATREGTYWAATTVGIAKFDPNAPASGKFKLFAPQDPRARRINVLYQDRQGNVLCGSEYGAFRLRPTDAAGRNWDFEPVSLVLRSGKPSTNDRRVISLFEDSRQNLWIGTMAALYRVAPDGPASEYRLKSQLADELWNQVLEDRAGRLWAATGTGLWRMDADGRGDYYPVPVLVPKERMIVTSMLEDPQGKLWLATSDGLIKCPHGGESCAGSQVYREANGIAFTDLTSLAADCEGSLWLGTNGGGAMRIARNGLVTYTPADGLDLHKGSQPTLFRDINGRTHVAFQSLVYVRRGERFFQVKPRMPNRTNNAWGWHQTILQDHNGEWWIPSSFGLFRYPRVPVEALSRTPPKAVYTTRDGLKTNDIFRVWEDGRGGIWVGAIGPAGINGLSRWDRTRRRFEPYPAHDQTAVTAFAEDRAGSIWIGYWDGTLVRYRGGVPSLYQPSDGLAGGGIQALRIDHARRLWIASSGGVTRVDVSAGDRPRFERFGVDQGLSSSIIFCLEEDRWGRMYLATARGLDRTNAAGEIESGKVRHYTQADGLGRGDLRDILFDNDGVLWCASAFTISRFQPERDAPRPPPVVYIRQVRVRGVPRPLSDLGETYIPKLLFAPSQNQLQIDFSAMAFAPGNVLRYQYRLDPADREWSEPSAQRTVNYSNVASGTYRFRARLAGDESQGANAPAVLEFQVLAPIWARWWFRALAACAVLVLFFWLHRYRTLRLLELERVRTRIATDLHDDIGSGLSQIAVLTEVARARADGYTADLNAALSDISSVARELVESMSDIVWSVNPRRDRSGDLLQRMRRFASDVLSGSNIDFTFRVSAREDKVRIPTEIRREVYLIFKEAVNNLARHSGSTRAVITISIEDGRLELRVEDNGNGLGELCREDGHGLRSMRERASRIGGRIDFDRGDVGGLRVTLRVSMRTGRRVAATT